MVCATSRGAVWSEPLLVAWILYDSYAIDQTSFGVSKMKGWLQRLVWVYTCQNATLSEITCRDSNALSMVQCTMSELCVSDFLALKWQEETVTIVISLHKKKSVAERLMRLLLHRGDDNNFQFSFKNTKVHEIERVLFSFFVHSVCT